MPNNSVTHVVTAKVRLSYAHLFKPHANNPQQDPKYSTTILLPKSDVATKQRIDAAMAQAKQDGAGRLWGGTIPPLVALPIHDGDGVRPSDGMPFSDECKGHWVFTASSKTPPEIVDASGNPIINQSEVYSGMYGRVSIDFFPYFNQGKKGIGCGLGNVQKLEDGEPLGSRTTAADDFSAGYQPDLYATQQYQQQTYPVQSAPVPQYQPPAYAPQPPQPYQQPYQQPSQGYFPAQTAPQYAQPLIDPLTGLPYGN